MPESGFTEEGPDDGHHLQWFRPRQCLSVETSAMALRVVAEVVDAPSSPMWWMGSPVLGTLVATCPGQEPMYLRSPACGDGLIDANEECDDFNQVTEECAYGEAACTVCAANCTEQAGATRVCGDGQVNAADGEACDEE